MHQEHEKNIGRAWKQCQITHEQLKRIGQDVVGAAISRAPAERVEELSAAYNRALQADGEAHEALEKAIMDAGINLPDKISL